MSNPASRGSAADGRPNPKAIGSDHGHLAPRPSGEAAPGTEPYNALFVKRARTQLLDCSVMIDRPHHIDSAPERDAEAISRASDQEVRDYVRRGIMERW